MASPVSLCLSELRGSTKDLARSIVGTAIASLKVLWDNEVTVPIGPVSAKLKFPSRGKVQVDEISIKFDSHEFNIGSLGEVELSLSAGVSSTPITLQFTAELEKKVDLCREIDALEVYSETNPLELDYNLEHPWFKEAGVPKSSWKLLGFAFGLEINFKIKAERGENTTHVTFDGSINLKLRPVFLDDNVPADPPSLPPSYMPPPDFDALRVAVKVARKLFDDTAEHLAQIAQQIQEDYAQEASMKKELEVLQNALQAADEDRHAQQNSLDKLSSNLGDKRSSYDSLMDKKGVAIATATAAATALALATAATVGFLGLNPVADAAEVGCIAAESTAATALAAETAAAEAAFVALGVVEGEHAAQLMISKKANDHYDDVLRNRDSKQLEVNKQQGKINQELNQQKNTGEKQILNLKDLDAKLKAFASGSSLVLPFE